MDLPPPLGKAAEVPADFTITRVLDTPQPNDIEVRYGGMLVAGFSPRTASEQLPAVAIRFGDPESAPHSAGGIRIDGSLDTLPVAEWWDVLRQIRDAQARRGVMTPLDINASGQVRQLHLLGHS